MPPSQGLRPQTNPKGGGLTTPTTPPLPQVGRTRVCSLRLRWVVHPEQFEHRIMEEKSAIRRPLPGVYIGRAFSQAKLSEQISLRGSSSGTDKHVVELKRLHSTTP